MNSSPYSDSPDGLIHSDGWISALNCAAIAVACLAIYSGVRHNEFVWDTVPFVLQNPWVQHPGINDFIAMFTQHYRANWQPLVWLSHSLDFALFDHHAGMHHLANVGYHVVDAWLVYWFSLRLLDGRRVVAFLCGLLFAINPQHVQSVAWLVERKDTLYVLFTLVCFISYLWVHRESVTGWRKTIPGILLACALMSKPMAVTIPVVLLLLDVVPLRRWEGDLRGAFRLIIEKWPYWIMSLGVVLITLYTQQMAMDSTQNLPVWVRPLTAINNSLFYIYCYLVPVNLSPFYPYATHMDEVTRWSYWLPGVLFLLSISAVSLYFWIRAVRWPLLMWIFYLVTLLPVSGLIAVGPAKALDYYSYLATLPLGMLISLGIVQLWRIAGKGRSVVLAVAIFYCLSLSMLTIGQVRVWQSELSVWRRAYQLYPDSGLINRNLAAAYYGIGAVNAALYHAERSARENPAGRAYFEKLKAAVQKRRAAAN